MSETYRIHATALDAGERSDRFLASRIGTLSRSRVKALIEAGKVWRAGAVLQEPAEPVRAGLDYVVSVPAPAPPRPAAETIPLAVLYEDDDLLVLDKPAGLVVHPAPGNESGTLVNAVLAHCGDSLTGIGAERRPGIVHRLDKDTSGVMVVAKNDASMQILTAAFAARDIERAYLALCWGIPNPVLGEISGGIGRDPRDRKRMAVRVQGGKPALTSYRTLATYHAAVALLQCRLATGRTHQIRVHLASRGHPVVGDPLYLRRTPKAATLLPRDLRQQLQDFPRQALHAARLGFAHPRSGVWIRFETPLPADMSALLAALSSRGI